MSEPYIGEIRMFGGNFAPANWALCDGATLSVSEYEALFSLLGTTYGGDGRTTFKLPDLRGRVPIHVGSGPGLSTRNLGSTGGAETVTLTLNQLPSHTHAWEASTNAATAATASGNVLADTAPVEIFETTTDNTANMATEAIGSSGSGSSQDNLMPYQVVNFIICLVGIYPSRH